VAGATRRRRSDAAQNREAILAVALAALTAGLCAWTVYRFSFGRHDAIGDPQTMRYLVEHCVEGATARRTRRACCRQPPD
jgi:hypothetical protein